MDWSAEIERLYRRDRAERRERRQRDIQQEVDAYLQEHPDATANAVAAEIRGRRREVLQAVTRHRERFPLGGNQSEESAA